MIRCMGTRRDGSSTAITTATAICRCTSSAAVTCWRRSCGPANIDASAGAVEEIARMVAQIRARWPQTRIILRADSGFARDALMAWCEANGIDFIFGLARNVRLVRAIGAELAEAREESRATDQPARRFKELIWTTRKRWSRGRRALAKAEYLVSLDPPRHPPK